MEPISAELKTRACEILERAKRPLTLYDCELEIGNGRIAYDSLYSNFVQRKRALETIQIYEYIKGLLQRAGID
ncbi:hypothetical protein [Anaerotruncus colihominis]|uniref:hypothetical protein n=1 Tax=Anaerotruncus colihominis TaxID=169435 RepID=UPI0026719572|nr:hypothetical protein [Anaerotruncus colihominis]